MRVLTALSLVLLLLSAALPAAAAEIRLETRPGSVEIGALYDGETLHVEGAAPAGSEVVLLFHGAAKDQHMKQKGRALGLLWMNLGSLSFEAVPGVYLVTASKPLADLGPAARPFTLEGVRETFKVEPVEADTPENRAEFVKLKAAEGLYRETSEGVILGADQGAERTFQTDIRLPSRLAPGVYAVEAVALKDGQVAAQGRATVEARLIGTPSLLSDMAFGHAALYGVLATVIAILAGLGIGLVFQSKGAH